MIWPPPFCPIRRRGGTRGASPENTEETHGDKNASHSPTSHDLVQLEGRISQDIPVTSGANAGPKSNMAAPNFFLVLFVDHWSPQSTTSGDGTERPEGGRASFLRHITHTHTPQTRILRGPSARGPRGEASSTQNSYTVFQLNGRGN